LRAVEEHSAASLTSGVNLDDGTWKEVVVVVVVVNNDFVVGLAGAKPKTCCNAAAKTASDTI
jgi:hypothetical protein